VLALAAASAAAAPARAADACGRAGVTVAAVRHVYGRDGALLALTEPGNAPAALAHVPACFVSKGGTTVATVRLYPASAWQELTAIYRASQPRPKRVPLAQLGAGAALYDVPAQPGSYEEDLVFRTGRGVVTIRSNALVVRTAPRAPLRPLVLLARAVRAALDS
jgi:hypothetical protein